MADLNLSDIQGFILRSYAMPALRVFVLRVDRPEEMRRFLGGLVSGDAAQSPQLMAGTRWSVKPDYCVNLGFTAEGLRAVGLAESSLASFPEEFRAGAAARAEIVGDTGDSAPSNWRPALSTPECHALLILFAQLPETRESISVRLRNLLAGAATILAEYDANSLPGDVAHFGYRDGFSQPTIEGGIAPIVPENLPPSKAGEFLLGYESQFDQFQYPEPEPKDLLGRNGSFMAFRVLQQDCRAFETFLKDAAAKYNLDPELIAAKMCGRWRNGVPLALSPATPNPDPSIPLERFNSFDYVDDKRGYKCPIGSHIRRNNPRNSMISGGGGLKHRIVRRGLPYGPPYDPAHPDDGIERGLLGLFIGVSLKDQFEFLMADWVNEGSFAPGIGGTKDPILGNHSAEDSKFVLPVEGAPSIKITGFSRFVTTRGGAYCFLPSVTAIQYLARAGRASPAEAEASPAVAQTGA